METKQLGIGFRIATTAIVWGFGTGMLAICIPIISMTKSGIVLPLAVILATGISTLAVWLSNLNVVKKLNKDIALRAGNRQQATGKS